MWTGNLEIFTQAFGGGNRVRNSFAQWQGYNQILVHRWGIFTAAFVQWTSWALMAIAVDDNDGIDCVLMVKPEDRAVNEMLRRQERETVLLPAWPWLSLLSPPIRDRQIWIYWPAHGRGQAIKWTLYWKMGRSGQWTAPKFTASNRRGDRPS